MDFHDLLGFKRLKEEEEYQQLLRRGRELDPALAKRADQLEIEIREMKHRVYPSFALVIFTKILPVSILDNMGLEYRRLRQRKLELRNIQTQLTDLAWDQLQRHNS